MKTGKYGRLPPKQVREEQWDKTQAAIASHDRRENYYGLMMPGREYLLRMDRNATRFIIVSKKAGLCERRLTGSASALKLPHESGALYNMLSHIIYNGLNMTEDRMLRPIAGQVPGSTGSSWISTATLQDSAVKNALMGNRGRKRT